jgi:hypothetical protein
MRLVLRATLIAAMMRTPQVFNNIKRCVQNFRYERMYEETVRFAGADGIGAGRMPKECLVMFGVGLLAYILIAGGSLVYCAARNLQNTEVRRNEIP